MPNAAVPSESSHTAPRRWRLALVVSLSLIGAAYFPFSLGARFVGFQVDGALYLLMAEVFSPYLPADPLLDYVRQVNHMPPLYPLLLGWAGASGAGLGRAHLVQTVFVMAGLVTLYGFAAALARDRAAALLVLWAFACLPATLLYSAEIWSEPLYLMLASGALYAAVRAAAAPRYWWWAAAFAGLATVTRGVGILLVAALLVSLFARRIRHAVWLGAAALAPAAIAELFDLGGGSAYLDIYRHYQAGGVAAMIDTVSGNADLIVAGLVAAWEPAPRLAIGLTVIVLAPFVLASWWRRLRNLEVDAWYLLAYAGVLLIWPFPHVLARLAYAAVPLILVYAVAGSAGIAELRPAIDRRILLCATGAALILLSLMGSTPLAVRYTGRDLPDELAGYRSSRYWLTPPLRERALADLYAKRAMMETLRVARTRVPPRECIHSRYPQSVMLHARRLSWPQPETEGSGKPPCRWHLVLSDAHGTAEIAALAPGYEVIHSERVDAGVAGILVRYPD